MKVVLFHQHGGPEVLEYTDVPRPEPKPKEALIRLRAAALNRVKVMDLILAGELKPILDRTHLRKYAAPAQERLWKKENFGKITLVFIDPQDRYACETIPLV